MSRRRSQLGSVHLIYALVLVNVAFAAVVAEDDRPFDCHIRTGDLDYDLTLLAGEKTVSRRRETPPTSMTDTVRFDLCADLKPQDGVPESDQCPSGTRVCLTKTNHRDGSDRIISVIPLVQTSTINPTYDSISPSNSPKGLSLVLHGSSYPSADSGSTTQSLNLTLLCSTTTSEPTFVSYDGAELKMEWSAPSGCSMAPSEDDPPKHQEPGNEEKLGENVGSGIGWFFLVLLLAFISYFALGMYYNYSTYGATGKDLIPHRDFWREVPYMLRDVFDHLCTTFRPRQSSRGGYIAV